MFKVLLFRRLVFSLLTLVLISGCAGVEPYEPVNYREDGPERGLFSGPGGEFVIYQGSPGQREEKEGENTADEMKKNDQQGIQ